eukprot:scaffold17457_cov105-Isochrysis_galbana.AAC.16
MPSPATALFHEVPKVEQERRARVPGARQREAAPGLTDGGDKPACLPGPGRPLAGRNAGAGGVRPGAGLIDGGGVLGRGLVHHPLLLNGKNAAVLPAAFARVYRKAGRGAVLILERVAGWLGGERRCDGAARGRAGAPRGAAACRGGGGGERSCLLRGAGAASLRGGGGSARWHGAAAAEAQVVVAGSAAGGVRCAWKGNAADRERVSMLKREGEAAMGAAIVDGSEP